MRKVPITLLALFTGTAITIAFRRPPLNPPVVPGLSLEATLRPPPHVSKMLRRACYDCHSNETRWPWYSRVPGLRNMLVRDVTRARSTFNFSEWAAGPYGKPRAGAGMLLGMCAAIREGQMPRKNYLMLHPWATPTPPEIDEFCTWSRSEAKRLVEDARRNSTQHARPAPPVRLLRIAR